MSTEQPPDPTSAIPPREHGTFTTVPPDEIARAIAAAAGWLRFMAIIGFIGAGFMVLAGLVLLVVPIPVSDYFNGRLMGILYLVMGGVYLIPLLPLNRAAGLASQLRTAVSHSVAVEALRAQAVFWKRIGILTAVGMALSIAMIPIAVIIALASR